MRRSLKQYNLLDEIAELGIKQAAKEWGIAFIYSLGWLILLVAIDLCFNV